MKRIVIGVIVAIVLLVAIDFVAASAAEYEVSTKMRTQLALPDDPAVKINGFPFLVQALTGDYKQVDVEAERVVVGPLNNVGVRAQLYHVKVPFSQVLSGSVHTIQIASAQGSLLVTKDDLIKRLPGVTKLAIQPVDDGMLDSAMADSDLATEGSTVTGINPDSAVRMVGTMSIFGQKMDVSVIAVLQMSGRQVQISPRDIRVGSGAAAAKLPQVMQTGLRNMFTLRIDPGTLPFSVVPTRLRAVSDALELSGETRDVVLNGPKPAEAGATR
ncbi:MAG TPA: DUF2993 domain-containing protein [Pseudonocardia sp.]|jgi:hypothetical protein|uniref:LmeA family phospholipid-binding protein n=1 Tax=Pseudonocardia sp. TaxID=60912 RepID=UPI002F401815